MLFAVIVTCEVGFWALLLAGLATRYILRKRRASAVLLACTPLVDLVLLVVATLDLRRGAAATTAHAVAAVYIGSSVGFGDRMMRWADARFAHRFAGAPPPPRRPRHGAARAAYERSGWYRHLLAWTIGCALLAVAIAVTGDATRTAALQHMIVLWTFVLAVDFLVSFSYTLFPKRGA